MLAILCATNTSENEVAVSCTTLSCVPVQLEIVLLLAVMSTVMVCIAVL